MSLYPNLASLFGVWRLRRFDADCGTVGPSGAGGRELCR